MQRKLRVWMELPPRHSRGDDSSTMTLAPASRAMSAALKAALPPPTINTSKLIRGTPKLELIATQTAVHRNHSTRDVTGQRR